MCLTANDTAGVQQGSSSRVSVQKWHLAAKPRSHDLTSATQIVYKDDF